MFFKLVGYDIRAGFYYNRKKYGILLAASLFFSLWFLLDVHGLRARHGWLEAPGLFDGLFFCVRGGLPYQPSRDNPYILPVVWMLIQVMISFLAGYYPMEDIHTYGQQVFMRSRKRSAWWNSKCIWLAATVTAAYLVVYAGFFLLAAMGGLRMKGGLSVSLNLFLQGTDLSGLAGGKMWQAIFLMPWLVSLSVGMLQLFLSFLIGPMLSFFAMMAYLFLPTYFDHPLLLGGYSMALKNRAIHYPAGYDPKTGMILAAGVLVLAWLGGLLYIQRFDVLEKSEK